MDAAVQITEALLYLPSQVLDLMILFIETRYNIVFMFSET